MNPSRREGSYTRLKTYHCDRLKDPIRVELARKNNNPEAVPFHKYQYMHHEPKRYKLDPYLPTPL